MDQKSYFRLRFAPSPTGYLHVGGARTALYNWLVARKHGGTFILRIEDTDVQRSSQEMVDVILNSMKWLGLDWDEGPFYQSERLDSYRQAAYKALETGKAYRCFCKPEDLAALREAAMKQKGSWRYDRICFRLSPEELQEKMSASEPYAVRFLVPQGRTIYRDLIHGEHAVENETIEDFVLLRSDGHPTYHLSVVVDDIDMKITHVIRGDDHISNTPKQILLYEALGSVPPQFGHLPLILGPDKKRLSKRHGAVAVEEYQRQGILPEALVNFLALLGWNPGDEREIFSLQDLTREFDLERIGSSNAVFDFKKLQWMNGKYLSMVSVDRILQLVSSYLPDPTWASDPLFMKRMDLMRTRATSLNDLAESLFPFYRTDFSYDAKGTEKFKKDPSVAPLLAEFTSSLSSLEVWDLQTLETHLRLFCERKGIKAGVLIHPIRLALTGKTAGPGLFEIVEAMGKEHTIVRLNRFLNEFAA